MDNMKPETDNDIRSQMSHLLARYDNVLPPAIFEIVRRLQVELAWLEHQGRR